MPNLIKFFFLTLLTSSLLAACNQSAVEPQPATQIQALRAQRLRNLRPSDDILPQLRLLIDSMTSGPHDAYYYSAVNVLVDQLFSEGYFSEADSISLQMMDDARQSGSIIGRAISLRIRGQMLLKLGLPDSARNQFGLAAMLVDSFPRELSSFSNATSIYEWQWLAAAALSDTTGMIQAGNKYATAVERRQATGWRDSTAHFPVTALSFQALQALTNGSSARADSLLRQAHGLMATDMPAHAYEHYYAVKSDLDKARGNWRDALACVDTLIAAHEAFPWFKVNDLHRRASLLAEAGLPAQSALAFKKYVAMHDSLGAEQETRRLSDLTVLFRSELDRKQQRLHQARLSGLLVALGLLMLLLAVTATAWYRLRLKNRLLVERLRDSDLNSHVGPIDAGSTDCQPTDMERLDAYMTSERPFSDPALGRRDLADFLGCSPEQVASIIRDSRGESVLSYINAHRLDEARRILVDNPGISISDVAVTLGFGTPRTLQRGFKERFGMSPSEYRRMAADSRQH